MTSLDFAKITDVEQSSFVCAEIVKIPKTEYIHYSYRDDNTIVNVANTRYRIRASLKDALRYIIRRRRGTLTMDLHNKLASAYCYWSVIVGLTDEDISKAWVGSK